MADPWASSRQPGQQWHPPTEVARRGPRTPATPPQFQAQPRTQWQPPPQPQPQFRPAAQPPPGQYQPPRYMPQPQPPAPRKSRAGLFTGLGCGGLAFLLIVIAVIAGSHSSSSSSPAASAATQAAQSAPASAASAAAPAPAGAKAAGTVTELQALTAAEGYLGDRQGFSRQGLIDQLDSSYGDSFSVADATWAVDHSDANWDAQAVDSAKGYMSSGEGFSRQGLIDQMTSSYGDKFTEAQAEYAANAVGL